MSTTTSTAVQTGTLPRVNLLPSEITESAKFRSAQIVMGLAAVAALVVVAGLWYLAAGDESAAQDDLAAAQSTSAQLQGQMAQYAQVPVVYAQAQTAQAQLQQAMSQEIRYSYVLNDLSLGMPTGVWLTNITITQPVDAPGSIKGAWGNSAEGTVIMQGASSNLPQVAGWLQALAAQKSYTDPYLQTAQGTGTTSSSGSYTWTSTVSLSDKALSHRYAPKAGS
jgi:Tfp pilus assembly protein PilN